MNESNNAEKRLNWIVNVKPIILAPAPGYWLVSDLSGLILFPQWPDLNFEIGLGATRCSARSRASSLGNYKMLTILAMLAAPILVTTIVMIVVFEIRDAWARHRRLR